MTKSEQAPSVVYVYNKDKADERHVKATFDEFGVLTELENVTERRYTMQDIINLPHTITDLEYYQNLLLHETNTEQTLPLLRMPVPDRLLPVHLLQPRMQTNSLEESAAGGDCSDTDLCCGV